jgi:hypothetical protein
MGRRYGHDSVRNTGRKKIKSQKKVESYPEIVFDRTSDFASIKLSPGVEAKSYIKDGLVFCEDSKGRVIEIQILNVSEFSEQFSGKTKKII